MASSISCSCDCGDYPLITLTIRGQHYSMCAKCGLEYIRGQKAVKRQVAEWVREAV